MCLKVQCLIFVSKSTNVSGLVITRSSEKRPVSELSLQMFYAFVFQFILVSGLLNYIMFAHLDVFLIVFIPTHPTFKEVCEISYYR